MADSYEIRCSVIVLRDRAVLLVHPTGDGRDDWVLPGGTPRDGESMTACAGVSCSRKLGYRRNRPGSRWWSSRYRPDRVTAR